MLQEATMSEWVEVKTSGGHALSVYVAKPDGAPRGGVIVLQEIFGVNDYIQSVARRYADMGYLAAAPSLYDRYERGFQSTYAPENVGHALELRKQVTDNEALDDIRACMTLFDGLPGAAIGFCFGGYLAWLAAATIPGLKGAVGYYPTGIATEASLALEPQCPVMLHFGDHDTFLPPAAVAAVRTTHADEQIFTYDADHGFECPGRPIYDSEAAALAQSRTSAFLGSILGESRDE
jgi:carboxymethylenebutenolidase